MDEDMNDLELGDLDLLGLEESCHHKYFYVISSKKIQLLKDTLSKTKAISKLGIQNLSPKY